MKSIIPFSENNFGVNLLDLSTLIELPYKKYIKINDSISDSDTGYFTNYIDINNTPDREHNPYFIKIDLDTKATILYFNANRDILYDQKQIEKIQAIKYIQETKYIVILFQDKSLFKLLPIYKKYVSLLKTTFVETNYDWDGGSNTDTVLAEVDSNGNFIKNIEMIGIKGYMEVSPPLYFIKNNIYYKITALSIDGRYNKKFLPLTVIDFTKNNIIDNLALSFSYSVELFKQISLLHRLNRLDILQEHPDLLNYNSDVDVIKFPNTLEYLSLENLKLKCLDLSNLQLKRLKLFNCMIDKIILPDISNKNIIGFSRTDNPIVDYMIINTITSDITICYDINGNYPVSDNMGNVTIPMNGKTLYFLKLPSINFVKRELYLYNNPMKGAPEYTPVNKSGQIITDLYSNRIGNTNKIGFIPHYTDDGYTLYNFVAPKYYKEVSGKDYYYEANGINFGAVPFRSLIVSNIGTKFNLNIHESGNNMQQVVFDSDLPCKTAINGMNVNINYRMNVMYYCKSGDITLRDIDFKKFSINFTKPMYLPTNTLSIMTSKVYSSGISFKNIKDIKNLYIHGCKIYSNVFESIYSNIENIETLSITYSSEFLNEDESHKSRVIANDQGLFKRPTFKRLKSLQLGGLSMDFDILDLSDNLLLNNLELWGNRIRVLKLPNNNQSLGIGGTGIGTGGGSWYLDSGFTIPVSGKEIVAQGQTLYNNVQF